MMLRGMGFDNTTSIYLASGKIYRAEKNLAPLLRMFPHLQTKESLATPEELASFKVTTLNFFLYHNFDYAETCVKHICRILSR